ncbi:hypothetical protein Aau02nite_20540 [Amorphoplanes auranticolor]|uniref:Uncharacterized protein n=1 Tax=Actinoplanes auranticolor TaxID=47988 RepID=A0A919S6P4_9ACTN|nr:hypothetical protein Aau02nite_20540 [Actinoplanes auranticolor]
MNQLRQKWYRRRFLRVLFFLALGAVAGVVVHQSTLLSGRALFAVCGGAVGLAAGLALYGHSRSVRLTEVTMSVPQFSQLRFAVTRESQHVAWKLFVELITRISTQPFSDGGGRLRSALTSLHGLLAFTRTVLKENPPSRQTGSEPTVEQLAITMLNSELRPFLTYWHRALSDWHDLHPGQPETEWPLHEQCRTELGTMQARLREYVLSFGELAGVPNTTDIVSGTLEGPWAIPRRATDLITIDR